MVCLPAPGIQFGECVQTKEACIILTTQDVRLLLEVRYQLLLLRQIGRQHIVLLPCFLSLV